MSVDIRGCIEKKITEFKDNLLDVVTIEIQKIELEAEKSKAGLNTQIAIEKQNSQQLSSRVNSLMKKNQELETEFKNSENKQSELKSVINKIKEKFDTVEKQKAALDSENTFLKENLKKTENIVDAFNSYLKFDADMKKSLENIFNPSMNVEAFFASGINDIAIKALYDIAKDFKINRKIDISLIAQVYDFFLNAYLKKSGRKNLKQICPTAGEKYDEAKHLNLNKKTSGEITVVILNGVCDNNTGEIKKALVEIQ